MATEEDTNHIESMLAHSEWVRTMAKRLISDPSQADDIAQEGWLVALRRPPTSAANLRGWWSRVLRNQARQTGRSEGRRREREHRASVPEAQPGLDELATRAALQREVVGHVLELDEPFRGVVLLRFFEDLSPPEIAERLNVPLKTVHSRLKRAFDRLRLKLDDDYGDRQSWCIALAPLAGLRTKLTAQAGTSLAASAGVGSVTGLWIMNANIKLGIAVGLVAAGGWGAWAFLSEPTQPFSVEPENTVAAADNLPLDFQPEPSTLPASQPRVAPVRKELPLPPKDADELPEAHPPAPVLIRGRAVNMRGEPIGDVDIVAPGHDQSLSVRSAGDGRFALQYSPSELAELWNSGSGETCLQVDDDAWITIRPSCVDKTNQEREHIVVAAPVQAIEGRVQDAGGTPIAGAKISLSPQGEAFYGFPYALDMTQMVDIGCVSDADGRLLLERFPAAPGLHLTVFADGFVGARIALDTVAWPMVIELARPEETEQPMLEGVVLDHQGMSVEGAHVQLASSRTTSQAGGLFRIPIPNVASHTPLCAAKVGFQPALIPDFGERLATSSGPQDPVELVLGEASLEIHGRVIDTEGRPCAGWIVNVLDETEISQYSVPIESAEALARGANRRVRTDKEGRFSLSGLYPREYRLQAHQRRSLRHTAAVVLGGSDDAVLVADLGAVQSLQGVVVGLDGQPIPDVRLSASLPVSFSSVGHSSTPGPKTTTDEEGQFSLEEIPKSGVLLGYSGNNVVSGSFEFPDEYDPLAMEIRVARRCHLRIEAAGEYNGATSAHILDSDGNRLQASRHNANGMSASMKIWLVEGKSEVVSVSEAATTLVLFEGEQELGRVDLGLGAEDVHVIRP